MAARDEALLPQLQIVSWTFHSFLRHSVHVYVVNRNSNLSVLSIIWFLINQIARTAASHLGQAPGTMSISLTTNYRELCTWRSCGWSTKSIVVTRRILMYNLTTSAGGRKCFLVISKVSRSFSGFDCRSLLLFKFLLSNWESAHPAALAPTLSTVAASGQDLQKLCTCRSPRLRLLDFACTFVIGRKAVPHTRYFLASLAAYLIGEGQQLMASFDRTSRFLHDFRVITRVTFRLRVFLHRQVRILSEDCLYGRCAHFTDENAGVLVISLGASMRLVWTML